MRRLLTEIRKLLPAVNGRYFGALLALASLTALFPLSGQIAFSGTARHVVVSNGVSSGNAQDSSHGWTFAWALDPANSVRQPGDTMYLHAGTYPGRHNVTVSGTAGNPLIYRNWNGQRVQLFNGEDASSAWCPWQPMGSYVWLWGVELAYTNPANAGDADIISIQGDHMKIINCVIHDALSLGIDDFADNAVGTEVTGNVFYYNGRGPIGGAYKTQPGYAAYVQNKTPATQKVYRNNILFSQWDCGWQFYGSNVTNLSNIKISHNVMFNNGNLQSKSVEQFQPNMYVGQGETGAGPQDRDTVVGNISWYSMNPQHGDNVIMGYNGDGYTNMAVDSNYFSSPNADGGNYSSILFTRGVATSNGLTSFKGNVLVGSSSPSSLSSTWPTGSYGNQYYPSGSFPNRGTEIRVDPNPYESKRANITVLNWGGAATVNVDLSSVLKAGDVYHIKSATNFYGPDLAGGTYNGGLVAIDANSPTMVATVGGYQPFQPVNPAPYLLSLVLLGPNVSTVLNSPPASSPAAVIAAASNITATGSQLNGSVNPNGSSTTYHFEYGTATSYGSSTASVNAGAGTGSSAVNAVLTGLTPATLYHYRIVATSSVGTTNSSDGTLTTGTAAVATPAVSLSAATAITTTGAQVNGSVNPNGFSTTYHFEYGATTSYGSSTASASAGAGTVSSVVSAVLSALSPATLYHYRIVASNSNGTTNSSDGTLTTGTVAATPPVVSLSAATAITPTGAQVNGSVNPSGFSTTYHFEYGATSTYGSSTSAVNAGAGTASSAVSAVLSGLTPATLYHYRVVATNSGGTRNSSDGTFTTGTAVGTPPVVLSSAATSITATGAQVNGTVNPNGFSTTYHFDYGATTSYGSTTASVIAGAGSSASAVSAVLNGLTPGTLYHYRLVASNNGGTTNSSDRTLTTVIAPPAPAVPVVTTMAPSDVGTGGATLVGTVNPNGLPATYHFEYGPTAVYGYSTALSDAGTGSSDVNVSGVLTNLTSGTLYHYRLVATNAGGTVNGADMTFTVASLAVNPGKGHDPHSLAQNYPNPFNPATQIQYDLQVASDVSMKVYNALGAEVATLISGFQDAGTHLVHWDGKGFVSGVYFCVLKSGGMVSTRRMILLR